MFNYSRLLGSEQCFRVVTKETGSHEVFAGEIYFGFRFGRNRCYRIVCRLYVPHRPTHVFCDIFCIICRGGIMARNKCLYTQSAGADKGEDRHRAYVAFLLLPDKSGDRPHLLSPDETGRRNPYSYGG